MSAYIITDGYMIAKMGNSVFSHLDKTKDDILFVNGLCFTSQNAAAICKYIKEENKITPIELGMSIGTINIQSENQSVSDIYVDIEQESMSDIKELLQMVFPHISVHYLDSNDVKETNHSKSKSSEKREKKPKNIEETKEAKVSEKIASHEENRPAFLRTFEEIPKKRGRRKKIEADRVSESLMETADKNDSLLGGNEEKNTKEEENKIIYPETLEELKDFPYKKDGRITREGKIAFIHLKDKYGATEIGQFLGIPATTIAGIYFRYKSGKLDVTKEDVDCIFGESGESIENTDLEKETGVNFDNADRDIVKAYIVKVPEKMKELMYYDRELVKDKSIDGRPLTGNIISDSELALGYKLSEADKSVLTNAFFSLTVYEEDFLSNLRFGHFSHLKDAPKLRNVCDAYDKIRRAKAHGRER